MTNSALTGMTLAATPTDMTSVGFFGDSANSGGQRIVGAEFQSLFGRHSTAVGISSVGFISNNTTKQRMDWDTLIGTDNLGAFTVASPGYLECPYQGYYQAIVQWSDTNAHNDEIFLYLQVNSVTPPGCEIHTAWRGEGGKVLETTVFTANAGDQVEVWQYGAGTTNIDTGSTSITYFEMWLVERTA